MMAHFDNKLFWNYPTKSIHRFFMKIENVQDQLLYYFRNIIFPIALYPIYILIAERWTLHLQILWKRIFKKMNKPITNNVSAQKSSEESYLHLARRWHRSHNY